mmetsp:Transcript_78625/g.225214  ORF Transcript_78625/g.225214 Transcript_78625/m.225214 type:complete len:198 (+) Transcript_78625:64-657(+)
MANMSGEQREQWYTEGKANARNVTALELDRVRKEITGVRSEITGVRSDVQEMRSEIQLLRSDMTEVLTSLGIQSAQEKQEEKLEVERQERVARKKQEDAAAKQRAAAEGPRYKKCTRCHHDTCPGNATKCPRCHYEFPRAVKVTPKAAPNAATLDRLMKNGYGRKDALDALLHSNGDEEAALQHLRQKSGGAEEDLD